MNEHSAQFLHREFGLLVFDIAELLGVRPQLVSKPNKGDSHAEQFRAWMTGTTRA